MVRIPPPAQYPGRHHLADHRGHPAGLEKIFAQNLPGGWQVGELVKDRRDRRQRFRREALYRFLAQDEFRQTLGVQKAFRADFASDHVLMEKILTLMPGEMQGWVQSVLEQAPPDKSAADPEAGEEIGPHQPLAALPVRPLNPKNTAGKRPRKRPCWRWCRCSGGRKCA